ncbi:RNA-directed DNA polymerase, eukaryota, reverse transcriptase zinc-binding domain protein [Tanacetum coccineum]
MVNVYGPQDPLEKITLWNRLLDFIQHHRGRYVVFGDLNEVRNEVERYGSGFSRSEAQTFNSFIDDSGLLEIPMGGRTFTWMNKSGTKMSKLDRFLLSEDVLDDNNDLKAIVLDRLWSDHYPILLHSVKTHYGPSPFKFFSSWLQRNDIDEVIKNSYDDCMQDETGHRALLHDKLKFIKCRLRKWNVENKKSDGIRKHEINRKLIDIELKMDSTVATKDEREERIQLLQELNDIDRLESLVLLQKSRLKWAVEGDENSKNIHGMLKQKRSRQSVQGIMLDGEWISNPVSVKNAFLQFYKEKFQSYVPQVNYTSHSSFTSLSIAESTDLERNVSSEEIKKAVWDCGSDKSSVRMVSPSFL